MNSFLQNQNSQYNLLFEVLENAFEAIVIVDPDGTILFMNKTYRKFLNVYDAVGKHVTDVIQNTRMHIVAKTSTAEISSLQRIKGHDMIANRIPIFVDNELVAVLGTVTFQDVRELHALAATVNRLIQEVNYYKEELRKKLGATYKFEQIFGSSKKLEAAKQLAQKVAKSDTTVLIMGESGTGKELFAHAIHAASRRHLGPFIRINCAAIPDSLLESELFGYEEGAFTGAVRKGKKGKFELANHGTILLDEIGDMPLALQSKLLRVLQEKEVERIGATHPVTVDVRVVSSTNRDLYELVQQRKFREDLYYRLNVVPIQIPPLRERKEDIPVVAKEVLQNLVQTMGISVRAIDPNVWIALQDYDWPGNVRQLRNVLERALHLMEEDYLQESHIVIPMHGQSKDKPIIETLRETVRTAEKEAIQRALALSDGDKLKVAKLLDISRSSLYQKLLDYDIET